eukprot:24332-Prorocentrum_minimum.AAC.1
MCLCASCTGIVFTVSRSPGCLLQARNQPRISGIRMTGSLRDLNPLVENGTPKAIIRQFVINR